MYSENGEEKSGRNLVVERGGGGKSLSLYYYPFLRKSLGKQKMRTLEKKKKKNFKFQSSPSSFLCLPHVFYFYFFHNLVLTLVFISQDYSCIWMLNGDRLEIIPVAVHKCR